MYHRTGYENRRGGQPWAPYQTPDPNNLPRAGTPTVWSRRSRTLRSITDYQGEGPTFRPSQTLRERQVQSKGELIVPYPRSGMGP